MTLRKRASRASNHRPFIFYYCFLFFCLLISPLIYWGTTWTFFPSLAFCAGDGAAAGPVAGPEAGFGGGGVATALVAGSGGFAPAGAAFGLGGLLLA